MSRKDENDNRPTSKDLARKSRAFVIDNHNWVIEYIKPMLPYIVVFAVISGAGSLYSKAFEFIDLATAYMLACFALSWHRAVLLGLKHEHRVNPFKIGKDEKPFLLAFLVIALLPIAFGAGGGVLLFGAAASKNTLAVVVATVVFFVLLIIAAIKAMRWSFMLPARSVGVKLSTKEASQISKGLLGRLFWAAIRAIIVPGLIFMVIVFVLAFGAAFMVGEVTEGVVTMPEIIVSAVLSLMEAAFQIFATALNVTILSYLYQWAVQNRPVRTG